MNCINKIILLFLICAYPSISFCSVETYIDKKDISIGDNISLSIKFTLPDKSVLIKPKYDIIKDWHIKDITINRDKDDHNTYNINMIITTFKPSVYEIPSIKFEFVNNKKIRDFIFTKPIEIKIVNTLASNIAEIDSLKNVKSVKNIKIESIYFYIFLAFIIYFIILFIIYFYKRKNEIKLYNDNRTKYKMIEQLNNILINKDTLKSKYLSIFKIVIKFVKLEYEIEYIRDIDKFVVQISDLNIPSNTYRVIANLLNKVKDFDNRNIEITTDGLENDINNLKLIISKTINKKG